MSQKIKQSKKSNCVDYFDFSSDMYDDCETVEEKIHLLGEYVLKNMKLIIGDSDNEFSLEEVEIYYTSKDHNDL